MVMSTSEQDEVVGLLLQHQSALRAAIRCMAPSYAPVDDLLQETNVTLWQKRDEYTSGTSFKAWAFTVARYKVMTWNKARKNKPGIEFDEVVLTRIQEASERELGNMEERRQALQVCMQKLDDAQRELIRHRYDANWTVNEYAEKVGRSAATLRKQLERVRTSLKHCIGRQLEPA